MMEATQPPHKSLSVTVMTSTEPLPVLLPSSVLPQSQSRSNVHIPPHKSWQPKNYLSSPQPPPQDENAISKLAELQSSLGAGAGSGAGVNPALLDGKILKKTRPRRTVDYNGGLGRLMLVCFFNLEHLETNERVAEKTPSQPDLCPSTETVPSVYHRCALHLRSICLD